jgi:hypothetical protein
LIEIFKRYIAVFGKRMPHQRGLAGLAWPGDDNHWIAAGEVLKLGFCVSWNVHQDVSCLLSMQTLQRIIANCQNN